MANKICTGDIVCLKSDVNNDDGTSLQRSKVLMTAGGFDASQNSWQCFWFVNHILFKEFIPEDALIIIPKDAKNE
jgi:hypothetical protein